MRMDAFPCETASISTVSAVHFQKFIYLFIFNKDERDSPNDDIRYESLSPEPLPLPTCKLPRHIKIYAQKKKTVKPEPINKSPSRATKTVHTVVLPTPDLEPISPPHTGIEDISPTLPAVANTFDGSHLKRPRPIFNSYPPSCRNFGR